MKRIQAVLIEGDGIGPEITCEAVKVLSSTGLSIDWNEQPAGLISLEKYGEVVPSATISAIEACGAALKGPFLTPSGGSQRSANWYIRHTLGLYACVRPIQTADRQIDILLVRENLEDLYGAVEWMATSGIAHAVKVTTQTGCKRIARFALELCKRQSRHRLTVVHKANNLKLTDGMFLQVARDVAPEYPNVELDDMLVDTAAANLVSAPEEFDVLLMPNTFGDILSSVGAAVVGGVGIIPSANYGSGIVVAEAAHGSAMELAGTQLANPLAIIRAGAMMLEFLDYTREAQAIWQAIQVVLDSGAVTPDLGGTATTDEVATEVASSVRQLLLSQ